MQPNLTARMRLQRDAEYGIAEYAPGSEVVADGLLATRHCNGGGEFASNVPAGEPPAAKINVVLNWTAGLK